ncbi:MAG TPA: glycosyltransferase [Candidatus Hydrogenedentes bacterium]|nr:glycosyltransferase [Candidatus Hydrogenedentota bacterium]
MNDASPEISVVVPVYNEVSNLTALHDRITATLEPLKRSFEIVMVDDGSSDGSFALLKEIQARDPRLRIIRLSRNFGQTPAMYAGFSQVRGRIVISLDADLQNPPEEIPKLLEKIDEGYEMVQGWREERQDSPFRRIASKILNRTVSLAIGVRIRDLGCGLKAYRREVTDQMGRFVHHSRYVPAEMVWLSPNIAEVKVEHQERASGSSKYTLWKLLRLNFDMVASVTTFPIKFVGFLGLLLSIIGFGMGFLLLSKRVIYGNFNPFLTVTALFFILCGIQVTALGLLCEYVSRIFIEVQSKPYYIISEVREPEKPA